MSDHLPREVLVEIFLRVPIKYLVRCTCVSKSWRSLITSPNFITTHLTAKPSFNDTKPKLLILRRFSETTHTERYSLHFFNGTIDCYAELDFPFRANSTFRTLNSCNGLLCLTDDMPIYRDTTIIWNPVVRKYVMLPEPNFTFGSIGSLGSHFVVFGFGYDHATDDYKVVRMLYTLVRQCKNIQACSPMVELYKLSTGSWESVSPPASPCVADRNSLQAFVNGAVHWLATKEGSECEFRHVILSFSMSDEAFGEVMVPSSLVDEKFVVNMSVTVIGGLLSLVPYKRYLFMPHQYNTIWVMKEYGVVESWTKLFTIDDDLSGRSRRMLGIADNCDRFVVITSNKELILYDPKSRQITNFGVTCTEDPVFVNSYVESLVLLEQRSGLQARQPVFTY